ncbi:hypothetical protein GCM10027404_30580 [Arthrobacter tumbae]|uniref:hypothetical protein n=1 Tax=Arthrobacter tumbae TaxID=163874 RepID=UPI00195D0034|nr:hypothetical protein [Arthrobacter tumbae]MBM7783112.1 uncharacterized membrane protein YidH (DUF202 family) [Arthrobacter tumbae]
MSLSISNSWRKHIESAGRRQIFAGSISTLIGVGLLIAGVSQYVEVVHRDGSGGLAMALFLLITALVLLMGGIVLSCVGYFNRRKTERRTRTYEDLSPDR